MCLVLELADRRARRDDGRRGRAVAPARRRHIALTCRGPPFLALVPADEMRRRERERTRRRAAGTRRRWRPRFESPGPNLGFPPRLGTRSETPHLESLQSRAGAPRRLGLQQRHKVGRAAPFRTMRTTRRRPWDGGGCWKTGVRGRRRLSSYSRRLLSSLSTSYASAMLRNFSAALASFWFLSCARVKNRASHRSPDATSSRALGTAF